MGPRPQKKTLKANGPAVLAVLVAVSLALSALYAREGEAGILHQAQSAVSGLVSPLKFVGALGGAARDDVAEAAGNATAPQETLSSLTAQNKELRQRIAELEEYRAEALRLQELLSIRDTYRLETAGGRIIGQAQTSWSQIVTIDRGENDGIRRGQAVMGTSGLVGQVVQTTAATAEVRLVGDPQSGIAAYVQSSRAEGIVRGSLGGVLVLENVPVDEAPAEGDVVVTSGIGGEIPRGLIIGTVVKVERNAGDSTNRIVVAPNAQAGPLQEVLVVLAAQEAKPSGAQPPGEEADVFGDAAGRGEEGG